MSSPVSKIDRFAHNLPKGVHALNLIRESIIGKLAVLTSPFGDKPIRYADFAASGRANWLVEKFIQADVLPYYANPHTHASHCGSVMNSLREDARSLIAEAIGAGENASVIFTHGGSTDGLNRLARLLTADARADDIVILHGPYEHHSNILPWRESGARVIEIREAAEGGPDLHHLEAELRSCVGTKVIGTFSAASNVTGILTDVRSVSGLLKRHGALSIWDYAAAAPYVDIDMQRDGIDGLVFSPHKFLGGPGASGVLAIRNAIVSSRAPSHPGGGTVQFVSPWGHTFHPDLVGREESGTPDVVGDIRAALAIALKEAVGVDFIEQREGQMLARALSIFERSDRIELLGATDSPRLPIISFRIQNASGGYVHHQLVTRILSDQFGVQARGGCACAGPYAHRLLGINEQESTSLQREIASGNELAKPGWCRISLHYSMTPEDIEIIASAIVKVAEESADLMERYIGDAASARFRYRSDSAS